MARISFGSPWLAAAGGLGQGLGQGVMAGLEIQEQRRRAEQQRRHDAANLLMQGIKNMPDDPDEAQKYMDQFGQVFQQFTGMKAPPWKVAEAKPFADKMKIAVAEIKQAAPNMSDDQAFSYAYHRLTGGKGAPKMPEERIPWLSPTGQTYMVKPGEAARADISALYGGQRVGIAQEGLGQRERALDISERKMEQETEKPMTPAEVTTFATDWQARLKSAQSPEEKAEITRQIKEQGGDVKDVPIEGAISKKPLWGPTTKSIVVPPSTKIQTKRPGRPGFLGKDAAYESFKKAYAKNPAAAIQRSKELGDGFAERIARETTK